MQRLRRGHTAVLWEVLWEVLTVVRSLLFAVAPAALHGMALAQAATPALLEMAQPLTATPGDAGRGRAILANRQLSLCILCHQAPIAEQPLQGNISTNLAGTGSRWTASELRLRLVDPKRLNPETTMPAFYRSTELNRVGAAWQGQTIFTAQQVEDVLAYLVSLK